jgi:chromosome segregation ATPase
MKKRENDNAMAVDAPFGLNIGLSEEKSDLEEMIGQFQEERSRTSRPADLETMQQQIDTINQRLASLSNLFLNLDRRIKPLYETIRLTYQKSEVLNQRINTLIDSIRMGEPL